MIQGQAGDQSHVIGSHLQGDVASSVIAKHTSNISNHPRPALGLGCAKWCNRDKTHDPKRLRRPKVYKSVCEVLYFDVFIQEFPQAQQ